MDLVTGKFEHTRKNLAWEDESQAKSFSDVGAWQSHGGSEKHPDRALPGILSVPVPDNEGLLESISFIGIFALHVSSKTESAGTVGAHVQLCTSSEFVLKSIPLMSGKHYRNATETHKIDRHNGDATHVCSVGKIQLDGMEYQVEKLTIDSSHVVGVSEVKFRDSGTQASFLILDIQFGFSPQLVCPFRGQGGSVSLHEIGSIIRLKDRERLMQAMSQTTEGIKKFEHDLDEARGLGLTFIAQVSSALLELGTSAKLHRLQLDTARRFENLNSAKEIAQVTQEIVLATVSSQMPGVQAETDALIDKALLYLDQHYSSQISDDDVADHFNVSTSHFRHLFRSRVGMPFHKYFMKLRLEKARDQIVSSELPVAKIAELCGFISPAHFSRAFRAEFGLSPSQLKSNRTA